eukprot:COSAG01_NODE_50167_length_365_cov_1.552632_1_plen_23_part_01
MDKPSLEREKPESSLLQGTLLPN